jgi:hypothetical protein
LGAYLLIRNLIYVKKKKNLSQDARLDASVEPNNLLLTKKKGEGKEQDDKQKRVEKEEDEMDEKETFEEPAQAMLAAATFAGGITFSVVLAPRDGALTPGLKELAYASSLFLRGMMGCILIIASIRQDRPLWKIRIETCSEPTIRVRHW